MKVKMTKTVHNGADLLKAGSIVEVENENIAKHYIDKGVAEEVKSSSSSSSKKKQSKAASSRKTKEEKNSPNTKEGDK